MSKSLFAFALLSSALTFPQNSYADTIDDFVITGNGDIITFSLPASPPGNHSTCPTDIIHACDPGSQTEFHRQYSCHYRRSLQPEHHHPFPDNQPLHRRSRHLPRRNHIRNDIRGPSTFRTRRCQSDLRTGNIHSSSFLWPGAGPGHADNHAGGGNDPDTRAFKRGPAYYRHPWHRLPRRT